MRRRLVRGVLMFGTVGIAALGAGVTGVTGDTAVSAQNSRSMVRGPQIRPRTATVSAKESVQLTVQTCQFENAAGDLQPLGYACRDYPDDVIPLLEAPSVNGIVGGNAVLGRVRVTGAGRLHYIAPDKPPARNPVTVSVALTGTSNGKRNKTILLAEVHVLSEDKRPLADPLPQRYSGSGTISSTTGGPGTNVSLFKYNATFQVAGGRAPGSAVGEYTLRGTLVVTDGEVSLPNCECTITSGGADAEAGLGVDASGKEQSLAVGAFVSVGLSCRATVPTVRCQTSYVVPVQWANTGQPNCPGSSTTTFSDVGALSGGYQRSCGHARQTASWMLTGEFGK